jgi:hypothetical protein
MSCQASQKSQEVEECLLAVLCFLIEFLAELVDSLADLG